MTREKLKAKLTFSFQNHQRKIIVRIDKKKTNAILTVRLHCFSGNLAHAFHTIETRESRWSWEREPWREYFADFHVDFVQKTADSSI